MGTYANVIHDGAHVHHTALIGDGTVIWHEAIILEGAHIGNGCTIGAFTLLGRRCRIGDHCVLHQGAALPDNVIIGHYVFIGAYAVLNDVVYPNLRDRSQEVHRPPIVEDDVVICSGAKINPGVVLHRGAFVGAGAVVTRDVPAWHVVGGVPAKRLWKARRMLELNEAGEVLSHG